ncbi:MAG: hypothetical protein RR743_01005 [Oscillospiraceae bacterium]
MTRLIVIFFGEKHCNIPADRLDEHDGFVYAYNGDYLVGVFDMSVMDICYLSNDRNI